MSVRNEAFLIEAFLAGAKWRQNAPTKEGHLLPIRAMQEAAEFWVKNEPAIVFANPPVFAAPPAERLREAEKDECVRCGAAECRGAILKPVCADCRRAWESGK